MPSTYAHYRMGEQVRKMIDPDKARVISHYPQLYRLGLHGPDIFFYYKFLSHSYVHKIGVELHQKSGKEFFERFSQVLKEHPNDERYLSYVYGVLNHFSLDMCCHGYVNEFIEESGVSHIEIETEFDRYLMVCDHLDPLSHSLIRHLVPISENAKVIAAFYSGVDQEIVQKAIEDMILVHNLLLAPHKIKRKALITAMKIMKRYDELSAFMVKEEPNEKCEISNKKLHKLYRKARKKAAQFINEYDCELPVSGKDFRYNFESEM